MIPCADETDHHHCDHDHSLAARSVSVYVLETVIFGTFGDSFIHSQRRGPGISAFAYRYLGHPDRRVG